MQIESGTIRIGSLPGGEGAFHVMRICRLAAVPRYAWQCLREWWKHGSFWQPSRSGTGCKLKSREEIFPIQLVTLRPVVRSMRLLNTPPG